jgi:two-component system OmpR family response regulator
MKIVKYWLYMLQILIVDDDEEIRQLLSDYLTRYGYGVHCAKDDTEMYRQLARNTIHLVVLDLTLPNGVDGLFLARELYRLSNLAIIMLTARSSPYDRIVGLESGADDYMIKPFEPRELVSRIKSVMRRHAMPEELHAGATNDGVICFDGWELHCNNRCLYTPDGMVLALSRAEFRLMCTFLHAPHKAFHREQLIRCVHDDGSADERNIDLLVSRLRQKLACTPESGKLIRTIRGVGYMFDVNSVHGRC